MLHIRVYIIISTYIENYIIINLKYKCNENEKLICKISKL